MGRRTNYRSYDQWVVGPMGRKTNTIGSPQNIHGGCSNTLIKTLRKTKVHHSHEYSSYISNVTSEWCAPVKPNYY